MYYIGLDVHKRTISYCVKDAAGKIHQEGKIGSTRRELDAWIKTLPQPRMMAMEATIFTGWIYDRLFHGLDLFFGQRRQQLSFRAVMTDAMSGDHEGQGHVQMLMDDRLR